ncbi:MAG TPA: hypothetical protein VNT60_06370 [Deinococcales bacterium]|nr:hypothetical protein [Deinococcales bacterium]
MRTNLLDEDTLLTTTYCLIDDLRLVQHRRRRGPPPALSDSEVITLSVLAQLLGLNSERSLIRYARQHWSAYFPKLISQSEFNRRTRNLLTTLAALGHQVVQHTMSAFKLETHLEVLDGTAVPLMRRCRGTKEKLFAPDAAFGRGGSDRDKYYGLKLLVSTNDKGFITGFVAGPANTEERWLAEAFFRWRIDPAFPAPDAQELRVVLGPSHYVGGHRKGPSGALGPSCAAGGGGGVFIADLNYRGEAWQRHWAVDYGVLLITPHDLKVEGVLAAARCFHRVRQVVESSIKRLIELGLRFSLARSLRGAWTRLSAQVAAHNLLLTINLMHNRPLHATT